MHNEFNYLTVILLMCRRGIEEQLLLPLSTSLGGVSERVREERDEAETGGDVRWLLPSSVSRIQITLSEIISLSCGGQREYFN